MCYRVPLRSLPAPQGPTMRPVLPALLLGTALAFFGASRSTSAASGAASLTPTPTVSPGASNLHSQSPSSGSTMVKAPAAAELLVRMRGAMTQRGSVHVDFLMVSALYPTG